MTFQIIPSTAEENLEKSSYRGRAWKYAEDTAKLKGSEHQACVNRKSQPSLRISSILVQYLIARPSQGVMDCRIVA